MAPRSRSGLASCPSEVRVGRLGSGVQPEVASCGSDSVFATARTMCAPVASGSTGVGSVDWPEPVAARAVVASPSAGPGKSPAVDRRIKQPGQRPSGEFADRSARNPGIAWRRGTWGDSIGHGVVPGRSGTASKPERSATLRQANCRTNLQTVDSRRSLFIPDLVRLLARKALVELANRFASLLRSSLQSANQQSRCALRSDDTCPFTVIA